jgi:SNF2 family DNA or RNA helicase
MNSCILPYLKIQNDSKTFLPSINNNIGKIKDSINCDELLKSGKMLKNEEFVKFVNDSKFGFMTIPVADKINYYDDIVKQHFDIYGIEYYEMIDNQKYKIQLYFYKLKHIELVNKKIIKQFPILFRYDYFIKNNIIDSNWNTYRMNLLIQEIEKPRFFNLSYTNSSEFTDTKLFKHQISNISNMLSIYTSQKKTPICDNLIQYFDDEIIFDISKDSFVTEEDLHSVNIRSGMILDEPGTGKTLQFIIFLLECKAPSLVLVPNSDIKKVWEGEIAKHIKPLQSNIDILTFDESMNGDDYLINSYEIIGVDEIHILYTKHEKLFSKIVTSKIPSRWGLTGTPFINDQSLFNIIKYLCGTEFKNETIARIPSVQHDISKYFLKNMKINMQDDYDFPPIIVNDVIVELDIIQRNLYEMESKTTNETLKLRQMITDIQLMAGDDNEIRTPSELKEYAILNYKNKYEIEVEKLKVYEDRLNNVKKNEAQFEQLEFISRIRKYENEVVHQQSVVYRHKMAFEYFMQSINTIMGIFENKEQEDHCPICYGDYTPPITYFKTCGHYFCDSCSKLAFNKKTDICCPMCRAKISKHDIITVNDISDINNSPKMHEIVKIIKENPTERFLIYTQFNLFDKLVYILQKNNIKAGTSKTDVDNQVLILSSENRAEGINLSMYDRLIIFEPFEEYRECKQIEIQLIARLHRVGRVKDVIVYRLITKDTIEEEIYSKY